MEQIKALNALEPFLALTKSASSPRAAVDLIKRATSAPNTFIYTELLEAPQIQNLAASDEFAPHLQLLQIFSYGTYQTYTSTAGLPALDDAQLRKLRQLSLLTLTREKGTLSSALSYARLIDSLGLSTARELEDLVISAIYAGLVDGQLDPKNRVVHINRTAPLRDVAPGATAGLLDTLQQWAARCDSTLRELEARMAGLRADAERRAAEANEWKIRTDKLVEDEKSGASKGKAVGGASSLGEQSALLGSGTQNLLSGIGSAASGLAGGLGSLGNAINVPRYGKRGSGHMDGADDDSEDEAMDLDDDGESSDSKKRASRRKL